jgi:hypothetical protein
MLLTKFATMKDLESYLVHPVHLEVSKYISTVLETGPRCVMKLKKNKIKDRFVKL